MHQIMHAVAIKKFRKFPVLSDNTRNFRIFLLQLSKLLTQWGKYFILKTPALPLWISAPLLLRHAVDPTLNTFVHYQELCFTDLTTSRPPSRRRKPP